MKRSLIAALAGLVLLSACGAGDPPEADGGIDLRAFWRAGS
ncbi:hypothetical protein [Pararhodobacter zhoushanensis]|uniref:Uncharacterized protein n=1 Tax=Pararhodobacter zhoushanensis TaxID=2479545 RepID=A0ABT3GWL8_9RHOB|nr:hypothetical protein [Pararhodobacter zhoushanensis]MCW1931903.1 hypothetical protein [Pararhodobacter zhoushanensis]